MISTSASTTSVYEEHCTYLPAMLGWFIFSALLSSFNKFVMGDSHMKFPCPLFLTSIHFSVQWIASFGLCAWFPETFGTQRVLDLSWREWAWTSIPCGMATSLDVGLSNLSMVSITISFYTMVKSSAPVFVLGWAYLFGLERITWRLVGVILLIAFGEFLTVAGETQFVLHGFLLCLSASALSGARWTIAQRNLQTLEPPLKTSLAAMRLLAPSMFCSLLFLSLVLERPWAKLQAYQSMEGLHEILFLGGVGGILAVSMVLCEFYLILHASALILMIGGVIKEMVTIMIGVLIFGDQLNAINIAGCATVFIAVGLYKLVFHMEKNNPKRGQLGEGNHNKSYEQINTEDQEGSEVEIMVVSEASSPRRIQVI
eukprot:Nitzschia sp. Nitz4//scaffold504_size4529//148//1388//NITZ4_009242-RA/size4529-augustus-gene-0.10-mRNA-1//1//CDS//3329553599//2140//frame0